MSRRPKPPLEARERRPLRRRRRPRRQWRRRPWNSRGARSWSGGERCSGGRRRRREAERPRPEPGHGPTRACGGRGTEEPLGQRRRRKTRRRLPRTLPPPRRRSRRRRERWRTAPPAPPTAGGAPRGPGRPAPAPRLTSRLWSRPARRSSTGSSFRAGQFRTCFLPHGRQTQLGAATAAAAVALVVLKGPIERREPGPWFRACGCQRCELYCACCSCIRRPRSLPNLPAARPASPGAIQKRSRGP